MEKKQSIRFQAFLFIALAYGWSWLWWLPAHVLFEMPQSWITPLTLVGIFGPALAGVMLVRWWGREKKGSTLNPLGFVAGLLLAVAVIALFWFVPLDFRDPAGKLSMPKDTPWAAYLFYGLAALLSGFVIQSAVSRKRTVREVFAGIIPDRRSLMLMVPIMLFLPALLITSNLIAGWMEMEIIEPRYQQESVRVWLPVILLNIFTVAILTGGNEEYGWRGVLLPMLQQRMSPVSAILVITIVWEFWHLPLVMGGLYGDGSLTGILIMRLFTVLLYTVLLTAIYNYSRGSIFLCVVFHACINVQIGWFGGTQFAFVLALLAAIVIIAGMKMWRRENGYIPDVFRSVF